MTDYDIRAAREAWEKRPPPEVDSAKLAGALEAIKAAILEGRTTAPWEGADTTGLLAAELRARGFTVECWSGALYISGWVDL
jgi:hypothetical protein